MAGGKHRARDFRGSPDATILNRKALGQGDSG
jgi:hypothetical protein